MNINKKRNILRNIIIGIITILLAALFFVGNYLTNYAIARSGDGGNRQISQNENTKLEKKEETPVIKGKNEKANPMDDFAKEINIISIDNLKLKGNYYENKKSHNWAILIHGYRGDHNGMSSYANAYYNKGFQVLSPDLRASGKSEGDYIGMGWLDKDDILLWIDWILKNDKDAKIAIHGVSMGAATTMMVSGENTPNAVKVFVEDCGYTSVWDIFSSELKLRFNLPEFPIMHAANIISNFKAGYNFKKASALEQVKKCKKPMLFIHGDKDDFVPFYMLDELYQAKNGTNKKKIVAKGAGHAKAIDVMGYKYWEEVFSFVDKYMDIN